MLIYLLIHSLLIEHLSGSVGAQRSKWAWLGPKPQESFHCRRKSRERDRHGHRQLGSCARYVIEGSSRWIFVRINWAVQMSGLCILLQVLFQKSLLKHFLKITSVISLPLPLLQGTLPLDLFSYCIYLNIFTCYFWCLVWDFIFPWKSRCLLILYKLTYFGVIYGILISQASHKLKQC